MIKENTKKKALNLKEVIEQTMKTSFFLCGVITLIAAFAVAGYLILNGLPAILEIGFFNFIFGQVWNVQENTFGILPLLLTTIIGTIGAILIGVPVGLLTAVFLSKIASKKVSGAVNTAIELLAGIPSVVYGFVGIIVLVPIVQRTFDLGAGNTLFSAIIVLSIMILPNIVNISRIALDAVPRKYEEASYALGANKIETIFKVSMPAAKSGIAAGIVLGIGRSIGEAMAVMMVAGNVMNMPGLFESVRFLTVGIAFELPYTEFGSLHHNAIISIGLVLFAFIVIINLILNLLLKKRTVK